MEVQGVDADRGGRLQCGQPDQEKAAYQAAARTKCEQEIGEIS